MTVRLWWDNARERDQVAVLIHLHLDPELAGVPWAFLPKVVQNILVQRVRINVSSLEPGWKKV
jgi:hypothetical protein